MLNLLRMQLRAVFRQKVFILQPQFFVSYFLLPLEPCGWFLTLRLQRARQAGMEITTDDVSDAFAFQEQTQSDFLGSLLFSGGLMSTLIVIVSSVIVCDDFTTGFGKTFFLLS